jgi:hypothetical protein
MCDAVSSIVAVFAGCGAALLGVGCLWPTDRPRCPGSARKFARAQCRLRAIQWPAACVCDKPAQPISLAEAHRAMQLHREHDCARKRAAFAALVAAGRIAPDSARQRRPWRDVV